MKQRAEVARGLVLRGQSSRRIQQSRRGWDGMARDADDERREHTD
jgi:hypothetical protein